MKALCWGAKVYHILYSTAKNAQRSIMCSVHNDASKINFSTTMAGDQIQIPPALRATRTLSLVSEGGAVCCAGYYWANNIPHTLVTIEQVTSIITLVPIEQVTSNTAGLILFSQTHWNGLMSAIWLLPKACTIGTDDLWNLVECPTPPTFWSLYLS